MANILAGLKRHNIYRVAAAYAVVAWVLGQLVGILMPIFDLPQWIARAFLLFLALGFPVVLVFAWASQLAPESGTAARVSTGKLDWFLAGALVVVIALVSYQQLAPTRTGQSQQAGVTAARAASAAPATAISVAVLPFLNLSSDKEQEFFSDGMTEEITSALAKVPNLRVVARTSAFQFKGENRDIQAIAQALHATHLIEGSVRKDGNELRITAQLIKADDGTHLWTQSYDRELNDVFAIQEDIAQAIAASLQVPLGLKQGETLVSNRTGDVDAYQEYLRARTLVRARAIAPAIAILERSVPRTPAYAPGWALLAYAYDLFPVYELNLGSIPLAEARRTVQAAFGKAEMAARKAIELDPKHASGYTALAWNEAVSKHWASADDLFRQASLLDAGDPDTLHLSSLAMIASGRLKQALQVRQNLQTLDPFVPVYNVYAGLALQLNGRAEESIRTLSSVPPDEPVGAQRNTFLALAYAATGRRNLAADAILAISETQHQVSRADVQKAARLMREGAAKLGAQEASPDPNFFLSIVPALNGSPDVFLSGVDLWMNGIGFAATSPVYSMWDSAFSSARKTERFKDIVRKAGLVDYWKARGWPDLCRPTAGDDFVCD